MSMPLLNRYLQEHHVSYQLITHPPAFTAQETAASAHIPGRELAKPVMVKIDGRLAMVVLPASDRLNLGRLREATGAIQVSLASESEFRDLFPECELGAMPPFGNLFGLEVWAADTLAEDEQIAFNAGNHSELMQIAWRDYERLVRPRIAHVTRH